MTDRAVPHYKDVLWKIDCPAKDHHKDLDALRAELNKVDAERQRLEKVLEQRITIIDHQGHSHLLQCEMCETLDNQLDEALAKLAQAEHHYKLEHICLICGRNEPCMAEADLKPTDPGIPCTFDPTPRELFDDNKRLRKRVVELEAAASRVCSYRVVNLFGPECPPLDSPQYQFARDRDALRTLLFPMEPPP